MKIKTYKEEIPDYALPYLINNDSDDINKVSALFFTFLLLNLLSTSSSTCFRD